MSRLFKASVVENKELITNHFLLTLRPFNKIRKPAPGTFFMVSVNSGLDPLLKRPISIHRWLGGEFQLLYRVVGKGTGILSSKKAGDTLELLGPLGNGFSLSKIKDKPILVAGGLGIAPIFSLADSLMRRNEDPLLFYGARTKKELLCLDEFKSLGIKPLIATDDGSFGKKGNILSLLKKHFTLHPSLLSRSSLYACGPEPMLKSLSSFVTDNNIKGFFSLERNMACGVGTCLGCVVNSVNGYKRVCKEGPVFPAKEIVWEN